MKTVKHLRRKTVEEMSPEKFPRDDAQMMPTAISPCQSIDVLRKGVVVNKNVSHGSRYSDNRRSHAGKRARGGRFCDALSIAEAGAQMGI